MNVDDTHVHDRLDDCLDGRCDERTLREVEQHLAECAQCRGLRDGIVAARAALRSSLAGDQPAPDLAVRIRAALDREDARLDRAAGRARSRPARIALPLAAGLALAALGLWWWLARPARPAGPVEAAFEQYAALAGTAPLPAGLAVTGAGELERRWERADLGFPARVLDLSAMGIRLAGGDATRLADAAAARALYRGGGSLVACWMFRGEEADLPPPAEVRTHGGFEFRIHRRGATTLVVWREGEVLCALASAGDPERVIALAFAKAMAPGAAGPGEHRDAA